MEGLLSIAVSAALTGNILLTRLIGLCPALAASQRLDLAVGHAVLCAVVLVPTALIAWLLEDLLLMPASLTSLRLLVHVPLLVSAQTLALRVLERRAPLAYARLSLQPVLLTTNCLLLAGLWLSVVGAASAGEALARAAGIVAGFGGASVLLSLLAMRLHTAPVPATLAGPVLLLVTAGIASLALLGLAGVGRAW